MKRIIVRKPVAFTPESLSPEQQDGIARVFTQWLIMPGTIAHDGYDLIDGVVGDNFEVSALDDLGLPFEIVGLWQWDGVGDLVTLVPLNGEIMLQHLPDTHDYDDEGNVIATYPPTLHLPANWSGWPVPAI